MCAHQYRVVQNCFLFKVKLLVLSNSALPERENPGNVLLTSRIRLKYFHQCKLYSGNQTFHQNVKLAKRSATVMRLFRNFIRRKRKFLMSSAFVALLIYVKVI